MSPGFTIYEAGTSLIGMVIRKCVFFNFANIVIIFDEYPAMLALGVMKMQTAVKVGVFVVTDAIEP